MGFERAWLHGITDSISALSETDCFARAHGSLGWLHVYLEDWYARQRGRVLKDGWLDGRKEGRKVEGLVRRFVNPFQNGYSDFDV